jgi:hypothetical protein
LLLTRQSALTTITRFPQLQVYLGLANYCLAQYWEQSMNDAKITKSSGAFFLMCGVTLNIRARAETIWQILSDAEGFPRWNSTVTKIEGSIREGQRIRIHVPGTTRTFTPMISGVVPNERMIWAGGVAPLFKGVRRFQLAPRADGSTDFSMQEVFSGLMLPLAKRAFPDFGPVFSQYAQDLKHAAEALAAQPC